MARARVPLGSPPLQQLSVDGVVSTSWSAWFNQVWQYAKGPVISTQTGSEDLAANIIFFPDEISVVSYVLPTAANVGDLITVVGKGAGGWEITQNPGQTIQSPTASTTPGTGTLSSTSQYDAVVLICITKDADFSVLGSSGTLAWS